MAQEISGTWFYCSEGVACNEVIITAGWGYGHLRDERYSDADRKRSIEERSAQNWNEVFVFFKHKDVGVGPRLSVYISTLEFESVERYALPNLSTLNLVLRGTLRRNLRIDTEGNVLG
jgi:hypothetical protein